MFKPKYTISNKMLNQLSEIAQIASIVERSKLLPSREVFLRKTAVVKMAHTSTSIEGNQLKEYQVAKLARGEKIQAQENQIKEVKNYLQALRHIDHLADSKNQFSASDILNIHKVVINNLVEKEKSGAWRKKQVYVVNIPEKGRGELAYTPPPAEKVPALIEDLVNWLKQNQQVHPIIRAGLLHYQFETIHPFTDGNGRTGRLTTLLHLYQSKIAFKKILVLEDYYNRNRKKYYEALQTGDTYDSRQEVDLNSWLEYFIEGFLDEARKVKDQVLTLSVIGDIQKTRNILDTDELKIVDFVVTMGQITSSDVVDILQIKKRTAQSKLKKLESIKVLLKQSAGPTTHYVIPKIT